MPLETLIDGYTLFVTAGPDELGSEGGLFHRDTRYLSTLDVDVGGAELTPVGETLNASNARTITLSTVGSAVNEIQEQKVAKHTELVVSRHQSVHEDAGYVETVSVHNHTATQQTVDLHVRFDADFADLFEVRGLRSGIDRTITTEVGDDAVTMSYSYEAADGRPVDVCSSVRFGSTPTELSPTEAVFTVDVGPQGRFDLPLAVTINGATIGLESPPERPPAVSLPTPETGATDYDAVFERAAADLTALTTETEYGPVPLAGTPWFATPFGRDALLTAHQTLAVAPRLAEGTLRYFAAHRGRDDVPEREEGPGKVFHERRHGELATRNQIPHTPYYGTVDATPLWVTLLDQLTRWRGDDALATELADALADALEWIYQASSDTGDDPFIYYANGSGVLDHKAWKDTADSIRYADGRIAEGRIAVAEVQGYAARALERGATLLDRLETGSEPHTAPATYAERGREIKAAFNEEFWLPDRAFYGLAKVGDGSIVDAVTSNVGHCLWTETIPESRADDVTETLVDGPLSSGWGLRTMSPDDAGYSPISYHAGGVWPHDTSLVALGLSKYGYAEAAETLAGDILDAATYFEHDRLPELYCGFDATRDPIEYPAACTPQAWAAGAPFAFLQAAFRPVPTEDGVRVRRWPELFADGAVDAIREQW
ncbi:hypothetical protein G9464_02375 [Halostella sp. JP-L12]|uniref:amylo-alpha-1,6-glucosidase n=1 Tax=Halostella TaxID=1843185 RepID=UPI000EF7C1AA|nr:MULTISPECIES: glycogen debranching N-terminal domain-containing protein [Halostella]NHN46448.1 hypothetical protein [Halostella sp. JP-L12]